MRHRIAKSPRAPTARPGFGDSGIRPNSLGGLKNALDWLSRTGKAPLKGKPVALLSAAAGRAGGEVAQFSLRHCLLAFGPRFASGPMVMIAGANDAFDENGHLKDAKSFELLTKLMDALKAEIIAQS